MARNPAFDAQLEKMRAIHDSKNHDYADDRNPYSNFEGAAAIAGVSVDTVFQVMIGIKVERLRQLLSGKDPNHESIEDTITDLGVYATLWASWRNPKPDVRPWCRVFEYFLSEETVGEHPPYCIEYR